MIKFSETQKHNFIFVPLLSAVLLSVTGCGAAVSAEFEIPTEQGSRDNTSLCLTPEATGSNVFSDSTYTIDYSNASEGYLMAAYTGTCEKVKFQITFPSGTTYTYNLTSEMDAFPLSAESGNYTVGIFENVKDTQYSTLMTESFDVSISNEFGAYLYPNQYVHFDASTNAISIGEDLAYSANTDLDVVSNVYNYVISNITYDYDKADTVESGYLPDVDATLESKNGICLDYASLMASMLRSQKIPTHLEVGYAGTAYHAWISTYITDVGWVNNIIEFDGKNWSLMDPTFGSTTGSKQLKEYIGDGSNYVTKYIY